MSGLITTSTSPPSPTTRRRRESHRRGAALGSRKGEYVGCGAGSDEDHLTPENTLHAHRNAISSDNIMITHIATRLIREGRALHDSPRQTRQYTGNVEADQMMNDLETFPHAFVLACVMDRQMRAEKAWLIPYAIARKLGHFEFQSLSGLSPEEIYGLMSNPQPLHRFPEKMSKNFHAAIQLMASKYNGKASLIWQGEPPSAEVVYRFLEFRGIGQKIATMAVNTLARDFKVKFSDYYSIDISIDVHVRRVFSRLGLIPKDATNEQIIYRARALCPEYPGLLDLPAWEIGRNRCKPLVPECVGCYMSDICPKVV